MTSAQFRCRQSRFRPALRSGGGGGVVGPPVFGAPAPPARGGPRQGRIAAQPAIDVEVVELLVPHHSGQCLTLHQPRVGIRDVPLQGGEEAIRLGAAGLDQRVEAGEGRNDRLAAHQPQPDRPALSRLQLRAMPGGALGRGPLAPHRLLAPLDHAGVEAVLVDALSRRQAEHQRVALVLAEQDLGVGLDVERVVAEHAVFGDDAALSVAAHRRLGMVFAPRPVVGEEQLRQQVQDRRIRPAIGRGHPHQDVGLVRLGVLDDDVEVAVLGEGLGVGDLELAVVAGAPPALLDQPLVGKRALRVFVEHAQVGVRRQRVEMPVQLLDVLAVRPLRSGEAVQTLLEHAVMAVPERQRQAQALRVVAQAGEAVLAPAIGPGAGMLVRHVAPGVAVLAVVLAHRAPLPVAQVGTPQPPVAHAVAMFVQTPTLGVARPVVCGT